MRIMECRQGSRRISGDVRVADSFGARFLGLMGRKSLGEDESLWLLDCSSIHCFFMRMTIDVVYLDRDMRAVGKETVRPWRIGRWLRGTKSVLELREGGAAAVRIGEPVEMTERKEP